MRFRLPPLVLAILVVTLSLPRAAVGIPLTPKENTRVRQGEIVVREVSSENRPGMAMEAVGRVEAPREVVVGILQEHERYPEFMPNVGRVRVVEQQGNHVVLDYTLDLPLGKAKRYRIEAVLSEPGPVVTEIRWDMLPRSDLKPKETIADTTGYWRIESISEQRCLVLYHVYTDPGPVPFGFGWIVDMLRKDSVPEVLASLRQRAEDRAELTNEGKKLNGAGKNGQKGHPSKGPVK